MILYTFCENCQVFSCVFKGITAFSVIAHEKMLWYNEREVVQVKDIPVFTTENGVASLVLQEIPATGCAYIHLRATLAPEELLKECVSFCTMVGATRVYATGNEILETKQFHTSIWEMAVLKESLEDTDAALWPAQPETLDEFRRLYNQKIAHVPNAAWMTEREAKRIAEAGEGYFVHRAESCLGIGIVRGSELAFVASLCRGAGSVVVQALAHAINDARITLQVASTNEKAVELYEKLGFVKIREISRWYNVFPRSDA